MEGSAPQVPDAADAADAPEVTSPPEAPVTPAEPAVPAVPAEPAVPAVPAVPVVLHGGIVLQRLSSGDFAGLESTCEDVELELQEAFASAPVPEQFERLGLLYAAHLLAYLLAGQVHAARFLWKRTPPAVREHAQASAAHDVLVALWRRKYGELFSKLRSEVWDAALQPLVAEVVRASREQLLVQIGEAYQVLAVGRVAAMLGLEEAEVRGLCDQRGWQVDASGQVTPVRAAASDNLLEMGEGQLKKLAEYVAYLEQPQCRI